MKRGIKWMIGLVLVFLAFLFFCGEASAPNDYGVFLGVSADNSQKIRDYSLVVIDAAYYGKSELQELDNQQIYSYLNVGSIETFRKGHEDFTELTLAPYEGWPDEAWVDVSQPTWQAYVLQQAQALKEKGVDGLFLDNVDVYSLYPEEKIYEGLLTIVTELDKLGLKLMVNGGRDFVLKGLEQGVLQGKVDAINQEEVFTEIQFDTGAMTIRPVSEQKESQRYLETATAHGLTVYLLEYGNTSEVTPLVKNYATKHAFHYYISETINLD